MKDYRPLGHDAEYSATLKMEVVGSSETSVKIYQGTRCHIPEDCYRCREELENLIEFFSWFINTIAKTGLLKQDAV
jgi:hypothetical protein